MLEPSKSRPERRRVSYASFREYVGNLHIHTTDSDGEWDIDRIAAAARRRGLDFIGITDHSHMAGRLRLDYSGRKEDVLVLVGLEIGIRHNHYLAFGISEMISEDPLGPQAVIDQVRMQGGVGFMAHPFEKGMPFLEKAIAYTWEDFAVAGYTGICIWNFSSRFKERIKSVFHAAFFLLFKTALLRGPDREVLSFWDRQCLKRRVVAIGGSDAHGSSIRLGLLRITPITYELALGSINVHILVDGEGGEGRLLQEEVVLHALREGSLFIAHDNLSTARGFRFTFRPEHGAEIPMGEEARFSPGTLHVRLPRPGMVKLIRNGLLLWTAEGLDLEAAVAEAGVYRIEVYLKIPLLGWRPWIFSNPIYLRE
jgi:hypothetical protein